MKCVLQLSFHIAAWNKNGILGDNDEDSKKPVTNASTAMNHLLLGKKPLVATKPRRPPHPGAIPSPKVKRPHLHNNGNSRPMESAKKSNNSATHYACPQVNNIIFLRGFFYR